jgi:hypothetical protein
MASVSSEGLVHLDATIGELLKSAGIAGPPVDARKLAQAMGVDVRLHRSQAERGRLVEANGSTTIVVRPEPRIERVQWTIAHEIGEYVIPRWASPWSAEGLELDAPTREWLANRFASHLLTPTEWFLKDAQRCDFDLLWLKGRYRTASHEVIAFRLLDAPVPSVVSIFDNGRLMRRLGNRWGRPPDVGETERRCRSRAADTVKPCVEQDEGVRVQAWPLREESWRREILRTEWLGLDDV